MPLAKLISLQRIPSVATSLVLFVLTVGLMAFLRLYVFPDRILSLSYGLPLLLCLWHPDRRLLWAMAVTFIGMAALKAYYILPEAEQVEGDYVWFQWTMQVANILVIALTVHTILNLLDKLRARNGEIEQANQELAAREEEISRQNEELAQQNEEIQQQSEEVQQQAEELQAQAEDLQVTNQELAKRQSLLQALLDSLRPEGEQRDLPERICQPLLSLFGGVASAAAVTEREGDCLRVLAYAGMDELSEERWEFSRSFASLVMGHDRTAYIDDLAARPDLKTPHGRGQAFRSILATPLRVNGVAIGTVEVYADTPQTWTKEQFQIVEWVAVQCALILETRRLRNQLLHSNAELDRTVKERTAELQDLVNELEHFSYTITHDLRAPLRAMHGFAGMLSEDAMHLLDEQCQEYLRRIATAAGRMDRLITDALSYSKAVRHELSLAPTDPVALLRGMIESYPTFQPPKASVEIEADLPPVIANEAGLTQCFSNLLENAVKFVPKNRVPHVRVHAKRFDGVVRISVEDNGIGIPREMQARVFGMFQRLSKDYEGTGIGLALVKKVTERMGGKVGLESEPGKGSRFWVELKAAK